MAAPNPTPTPKAPGKGGLPKWAWVAAIVGGAVVGFVFLRDKSPVGSSETVGVMGGNAAPPLPPQQQGSNEGDLGSILGALGLLSNQVAELKATYGGSSSAEPPPASSSSEPASSSSSSAPAPALQATSSPGDPAIVPGGVTPLPTWGSPTVAPSETPYGSQTQASAPGGWQISGAAGGAAGVGGGPSSPSLGVQWGGQTFYTKAELGSWLSAHGANYATWAKNHPGAAAKLK